MGLLDFLLPPRRRRISAYNTDWEHDPELQPIAGVSLATFAAVSRGLAGPAPTVSMAAMAEQAGVSQAAWIQAYTGWQQRMTQSQNVRVAMTKVARPDLDPRPPPR